MVQPDRPYAGRSKVERAAERRGRLVAATVTLLGTHGEARTTMTAICAQAGLTERYFYESFRARDDALVAALDAVATEIAEAALAAVRASERLPRGAGPGGPRRGGRHLVDDPGEGPCPHPGVERQRRTARTSGALVGWFADLVATQASSLFGQAARSGTSAAHHAVVFVAGFAELVGSWLDGDVALERDELVELGADLLATVVRRPG